MSSQQHIFIHNVLPQLLASGNGYIYNRQELIAAAAKFEIGVPQIAFRDKVGRGQYDLTHLSTGSTIVHAVHVPAVDERTDAEIETAINDRFNALDRMAFGVAAQKFRSMIVSGNAGIGKTYALEYILEGAAAEEKIQFTAIRGYVKPTGLYKLLWECRHENCVLMFDDADSVFNDEIGLNLLKGALDTTKRRTISWRSEKEFESEDGEAIPNSFDFKGAVVFITNIDFDAEVRRNSKLTPHLQALISRSFYLDLNLGSARDLMVRIKSVIAHSDMLSHMSAKAQKALIEYMDENCSRLRELSLRMALKLAQVYQGSSDHKDFVRMANATCLKQR